MSDKNIDKDIEVLELTIECLKETMEYEDIYETEVSHIVISKKDMESFDNVLLELEIKDKMIDKLAEYGVNCAYGIPVKFKSKEELIEIVKEEVLKDE